MTRDPLRRFRRAWRIPTLLGRGRQDEPFPELPAALSPPRSDQLPANRRRKSLDRPVNIAQPAAPPSDTDRAGRANLALGGEVPSVTVPLPDERIRQEIAKTESAIDFVERTIAHQEDQLRHVRARGKLKEDQVPIVIPVPWIGQLIGYLSFFDSFDKHVVNPRTIVEFEKSIRFWKNSRDQLSGRLDDLQARLKRLE